jgi:hypothetical protein
MDMLRKDDNCPDIEGMRISHLAKRPAQCIDMLGQKRSSPIGQVDRIEIGPAGDAATAVVGHLYP